MKTTNQLNIQQRLSIGLSLCATVILIFLHNPFSGYTTTKIVERIDYLEPCTESEKNDYRNFLANFYNSEIGRDQREIAEIIGVDKFIDKRVENCHLLSSGSKTDSDTNINLDEISIPIFEWESVNPLVEWLRSFVNFTYGILASLFIGAIFSLFVFRSNR